MTIKGRAPYRFLNRKSGFQRAKSERLAKRVVSEEILNSFIDEKGVVIGCCSNECCSQLLGVSDSSSLALPTTKDLRLREAFRDAVLETRKAIHEGGQVQSGKRLVARLRLGFSQGEKKLRFNPFYNFPGSRSSSKQEYWWTTEEGDRVQVNPFVD